MSTPPSKNPPPASAGPETGAPAPDSGIMELQEVRYSLPLMLRELQFERTQSYFAKEIIDQVEISKIFAQARRARAKGKQY